jgi:hypothetical protein
VESMRSFDKQFWGLDRDESLSGVSPYRYNHYLVLLCMPNTEPSSITLGSDVGEYLQMLRSNAAITYPVLYIRTNVSKQSTRPTTFIAVLT